MKKITKQRKFSRPNYSVTCKPPFVFPRGKRLFNRERIWHKYFAVRSSSKFITRWTTLLQQASATPTLALYQHLTDIIFKDLVKEPYIIPSREDVITEDVSILEENAL